MSNGRIRRFAVVPDGYPTTASCIRRAHNVQAGTESPQRHSLVLAVAAAAQSAKMIAPAAYGASLKPCEGRDGFNPAALE
jgi:hypothetical protein